MRRKLLAAMARLAALIAFPATAAELEMDFNANLDVKGLDRPAAAEGKARFADDDSAVIGPDDRYYVAHRGTLSAEQGSLELRLRPIDWDGDAKAFQFFFTCRQGQDTIQLQKAPNGMLQFLIGTLTDRQYATAYAPVTHWQRDEWHTVRTEWTPGRLRLWIDGELLHEVERKPGTPAVAEKFILGGKNYLPCEGLTAIDHLKLDDRPPPEPAPKAAEVFQRLPRNIATPEYGAVLLPSSQFSGEGHAVHAIEMAQDGVGKSFYLSAVNSPDNWIEARWPAPVTLDGFQVLFEEPLGAKAVGAFARRDGAWSPVAAIDDAARTGEFHTFEPVFTDRLRFFFR